MRNRIIRPFLALLAAAVLAMPLLAQNPGMPARQRLQANLSALRLVRLTQALDLTEEQTAKVFPVLNKIEKGKQDIQKSLSQDILQLRRLCLDPETKDVAFEDITARIKEQRARIRALDEEGDAVLTAVLDPRQRARYEIFQIDFLRGINETMNQARQRMGRGQMMTPQPPVKK